MLNFKHSIWLFILMVVVTIIMIGLYSLSWWLLLVPALIYSIMLAYGSANIQSGFFIDAVCNGDNQSNSVALTFDDGPAGEKTEKILEVLKQNNVRAAFFCIGKRMENSADLLKRIVDEGHMIGNHSYSHHVMFDLMPLNKMKSELVQTNDIARKITGLSMTCFRPPYGVTTPNLAKAINDGGFHTVGWNVRSLDTVVHDTEKLKERITKNLKGGDIILLHDTSEATVNSLQSIIDSIRAKGLSFTRLDELINVKAYA